MLRAIVVLLVAMLVAGCGPADKRAAVHRVVVAARLSHVRSGRLVVSSRPERIAPTTGIQIVTLPALLGGNAPAPIAALDLMLDQTHRRAALLAPAAAAARIGPGPGGGRPALVLFDASMVYVRRAGLQELGARAWYAIDTHSLGPVGTATTEQLIRPRTIGDLAVLSPIALVEQADGLLTGSVKVRATRPTAEYVGNASIDKVARQLHRNPDAARPTKHLLSAFAAHDDINPISVWVSPSGSLAELLITFTSRPERGVRFGVAFDLALDATPPAVSPATSAVLTAPAAADTVRVTSLEQIRSALDQWGLLRPGAAPGAVP